MKKIIEETFQREITLCDFCGVEVMKGNGFGYGDFIFHSQCHTYAVYPEEVTKLLKELPILLKKFKTTEAYKELKKDGKI